MRFLIKALQKQFPKKSAWLYETLFMMVVLICLAKIFKPELIFSSRNILNPLWLPILLTAPRYGFGPGVIVGLIAFMIQIMIQANGFPSRTYMEIAAESGGLTLPILFLVISVFLGSLRQKYLEKEQSTSARLQEAEFDLSQIKNDLETSNAIKTKLESRIVSETKTIQTLYESSIKLESLDLKQIRQGCLEIFKKNFDVTKASYYIVQDQHFVLAASVGWDEGRDSEAKVSINKSVLKYALHSGKCISAKEIIRNQATDGILDSEEKPFVILPLSENTKNKDAVISIEAIDFLALNQANINMMSILAEWTSKAIQNAVFIEQAKMLSMYSDVDGVAGYNLLIADIAKEHARAVAYQQPLSIITLRLHKYGFMKIELQDLLKRLLITSIQSKKGLVDRIYKHRFEGIYFLVCPMRDEANACQLLNQMKQSFHSIGDGADSHKKEILSEVCTLDESTPTSDEFLKKIFKQSGLQ